MNLKAYKALQIGDKVVSNVSVQSTVGSVNLPAGTIFTVVFKNTIRQSRGLPWYYCTNEALPSDTTFAFKTPKMISRIPQLDIQKLQKKIETVPFISSSGLFSEEGEQDLYVIFAQGDDGPNFVPLVRIQNRVDFSNEQDEQTLESAINTWGSNFLVKINE